MVSQQRTILPGERRRERAGRGGVVVGAHRRQTDRRLGRILAMFMLAGVSLWPVAAFADTIDGDDNSNVISGSQGDDTIDGKGGDDRIAGHDGNDTVKGGTGNDSINGGNGNDTVNAGDGDDPLVSGDAGDDEVNGGEGNDSLDGGVGIDEVNGDAGDDLVFGGDGDDFANGSAGNDTVFGDAGNDLLTGGDGDDRLKGGDGDDFIVGDAGNDILCGEGGQNVLYGGGVGGPDDDSDLACAHDDAAVVRKGVQAVLKLGLNDEVLIDELDEPYPRTYTLVGVAGGIAAHIDPDNGVLTFTATASGILTYAVQRQIDDTTFLQDFASIFITVLAGSGTDDDPDDESNNDDDTSDGDDGTTANDSDRPAAVNTGGMLPNTGY